MVNRVARAICGNSLSGYCSIMGDDLGCKVGRGESFTGANCKAPAGALMLSMEWRQAQAAIKAMRQPTATMLEKGSDAMKGRRIDGDAKFSTLQVGYLAMIDAALADDGKAVTQ